MKLINMHKPYITRPTRQPEVKIEVEDSTEEQGYHAPYLHHQCQQCENTLLDNINEGNWENESGLLQTLNEAYFHESKLEPFDLYRHFHPLYQYDYSPYENIFEPIALPGKMLKTDLRIGDVVLLRNIFSGKTLQAVITNPELLTNESIDGNSSNSQKAGYYVQVYSGITGTGNKNKKDYLRITNNNSYLSGNIMILRKTSSGDVSNEYDSERLLNAIDADELTGISLSNSESGNLLTDYPENEHETQDENFHVQDESLYVENTIAPPSAKQQILIQIALFFPPDKNAKATLFNQTQVKKSGLQLADLVSALDSFVDIPVIKQTLLSYNQTNPGKPYQLDLSGSPAVDAVFTEAIHQFQMANYINPKEHDGVLGLSTLDTLGFIKNGLKRKLDSSNFYGQTQLNRDDVKPLIPQATNNEFTAGNWYDFILKPSWLGVKISDGIHISLLRKLREAEAWLLSQPQYKGISSAALGIALGFNANTRYSAARLSAKKQSMHGFGLAIDINVAGNPWIGAGWVKHDQALLKERTRMIEALKKASGDKSLPGNTVFAYLHSIAQSAGTDTTSVYKILKQKNDEFVSYLKNNQEELRYWKNSQTFGDRDPLNGFLNLHPDLVFALRQIAGLAWGAVDFGAKASGDIMHFDLRTIGIGKILCNKIGGFVPEKGHPIYTKETLPGESAYQPGSAYDATCNEADLYEDNEVTEWENDGNELSYREETKENNRTGNDIFFSGTDEQAKNWSDAIRLNDYYGNKLGWNKYIYQINSFLLPFSGHTNVSLGNEAFARAVANWQRSQGFTEKNSDGIIGPNAWRVIKPVIIKGQDVQPDVSPVPNSTSDTVIQTEWANHPNINAGFQTWQAYKKVRDQVVGWGISNPAPYIESAIQEWNANTGIHSHFDHNLFGDPHHSYLNLKRLYQAKGIANPAAYFSANIVSIKFFNRTTSGHKDLRTVLSTAQTALTAAGHNFILDRGTWSFVPRTFNNNFNKLSNHALGKAIDINPSDNPHITSGDDIKVIDAVCRTILTNGILKETDPDTLLNASRHFQQTFNDAWIAQQTQRGLTDAIKKRRTALNKYAHYGFLNLPGPLIKGLQNAGLNWGGAWKSAKDFMHFEL